MVHFDLFDPFVRLFCSYLIIIPVIIIATIHRFLARKARPFAPQENTVASMLISGTRIGR